MAKFSSGVVIYSNRMDFFICDINYKLLFATLIKSKQEKMPAIYIPIAIDLKFYGKKLDALVAIQLNFFPIV